MNTKKMTQKEFDEYVMLTLIPELEEEHGTLSCLIMNDKRIMFARECEVCHDLILIKEVWDLPKEIISTEESNIKTYLEILTNMDVYNLDDILECECFDDEIVDPKEDDPNDEVLYEDDTLEDIEDLYDDYDEY